MLMTSNKKTKRRGTAAQVQQRVSGGGGVVVLSPANEAQTEPLEVVGLDELVQIAAEWIECDAEVVAIQDFKRQGQTTSCDARYHCYLLDSQ